MQTSSIAEHSETAIDVQAIPPQRRHPFIIQAVYDLAQGEFVTLVNDHDPRPLHLQLRMLFGDDFAWDYLEQGPGTWRVRITKTAQTTSQAGRSGSCCGGMCG